MGGAARGVSTRSWLVRTTLLLTFGGSHMAVQARSTTSLLSSAVAAGIIGGILIDAFLAIIFKTSPIELWSGVAATVVGPGSAWWIGLVVHFVVSIVWAVLYLYIFSALGQLKNWIVGAIVWGLVVDACMQAIVAAKTGSNWWQGFGQPIGIIAHIVFYALPVALYFASAARRTA
jgi:hypothetical protein